MKGGDLYHIHRRKRSGKTTDPYPSPHPLVRLLDKTAIAAGVIGPVMTIPQIWQIFHYQNAAGVSALSWGAFAVLDIPFIAYGFIHKNTLIKVTYIGWLAVNAAVAVGAVMYG